MDVTLFNAQGLRSVQTPDIKKFVSENKEVLWIDICTPRANTLTLLKDLYGFHPLAIEDTTNQQQRPKVEEYDDHLFIIINNIVIEDGVADFRELDIFIGRDYIVTVHENCAQVIREARDRIERKAMFRLYSSEYLLYALLDTVVDGYFPVLDQIDTEIENLTETVLAKPTKDVLRRLFELRRTLNELWHVIGQQRDMFSILTRREEDLLTHHDVLEYYMRDVHDHLIRLTDITNITRENVHNIVDLYVSSTSNQLNLVVNRLTIITIIIGILTVISGFYGMNFEQTWPPFSAALGVPFVLTLMVFLAGGVLVLFKRLRFF